MITLGGPEPRKVCGQQGPAWWEPCCGLPTCQAGRRRGCHPGCRADASHACQGQLQLILGTVPPEGTGTAPKPSSGGLCYITACGTQGVRHAPEPCCAEAGLLGAADCPCVTGPSWGQLSPTGCPGTPQTLFRLPASQLLVVVLCRGQWNTAGGSPDGCGPVQRRGPPTGSSQERAWAAVPAPSTAEGPAGGPSRSKGWGRTP